MMFATVAHNLKSPENTGMILRTHVAFGGECFVMVGPEPWRFKKRTQAFSRKLERICRVVYLPDDDSLFDWCQRERFQPIAIEIAEHATLLPAFRFPDRPAIIVGHEGYGLSDAFLRRCSGTVTIPQFGPVGCLNVAVSCSLALYELNRNRPLERAIEGHQFRVADSERQDRAEPSAPMAGGIGPPFPSGAVRPPPPS
jgi:tRNA G18 (ribose-2'-O)-methylase SpoU